MGKLLAGCSGNSAPITFQPAGQPPRGPSFVCPGGGSAAARAARCEPGAPGSASGRARRSRWAAHPRSKQGLSIFRAEEATISRAERPPRLASPAALPVSPAPPGTGDSPHAAPATPRPRTPGPVPCIARGGRSSPRAHRPAHRNPPTPARKDPRPSASRGEGKPSGPSHRENLAPGVRAWWAAAS